MEIVLMCLGNLNWTAIGVLAAIIIAIVSNRQIQKQLKIEQTPYIVLKGSFITDAYIKMRWKNELGDSMCDYETDGGKKLREEYGVKEDFYTIRIHNIGRGPALNITISQDDEKPSDDMNVSALFRYDQPHSQNLFSGETITWIVDKTNLSKVPMFSEKRGEGEDWYINLYIRFFDQLKNAYKVRAKLRIDSEGRYKVMGHKIV